MAFIGPPSLFGVEGSTGASAQTAMAVTIFHWGFHAWAIYAIIGLALAFFCFNKGFFVTSSDSGSLVVDTITSGGNLHPPVVQKVFWASAEGIVAAVLLISGGLGALQSSSIAAGFPFAIILC